MFTGPPSDPAGTWDPLLDYKPGLNAPLSLRPLREPAPSRPSPPVIGTVPSLVTRPADRGRLVFLRTVLGKPRPQEGISQDHPAVSDRGARTSASGREMSRGSRSFPDPYPSHLQLASLSPGALALGMGCPGSGGEGTLVKKPLAVPGLASLLSDCVWSNPTLEWAGRTFEPPPHPHSHPQTWLNPSWTSTPDPIFVVGGIFESPRYFFHPQGRSGNTLGTQRLS